MKRVIAVILVLCMALSLCACSSSGSGSASGEKVIKIGVFEPSSGDSASGGKKEILGMQYANSQEPTVTLGGETYKVELVYGDNGSSTDKAPSAASSLVSAGVSVLREFWSCFSLIFWAFPAFCFSVIRYADHKKRPFFIQRQADETHHLLPQTTPLVYCTSLLHRCP